jgi:putative transposase
MKKQQNVHPSLEAYQNKIAGLKTYEDATSFVKSLVAPVLQKMLDAEMENHLGYKKYASDGRNSGNSRNGFSEKTLKTSEGNMPINIPRDRNGDFEPQAVPRYQTIPRDMEQKIIAMYAKGLTTRDINAYMFDIYGVDVSASLVSQITDSVMGELQEWQERPLEKIYPIIYFDGIYFKMRRDGKIVNTCAYIVLGINGSGRKEILGIWLGEAESSVFWMKVLNELKQRGVEEILITCMDGLNGFPEALQAIFPTSRLQRCIVHQVRNTLKYISHKDKKEVVSYLKRIYTATNEAMALKALEDAELKFPQYAQALKSWRTNWANLTSFFDYPAEIRKIIYTTNTIESLNRQFRKVTKTSVIFPNEKSLEKLLYLAQRDIARSWSKPLFNWGIILSQFVILFPDKNLEKSFTQF